MKIISTILSDFIEDFNIQSTDVGVCFDAILDFNLPTQNFNLQSEVHMESALSKYHDTITLLNPIIPLYKMPTFFNPVNHEFIYIKQKGILIVGWMELFGNYTISILPKRPFVSRKTLAEIRAKKLN